MGTDSLTWEAILDTLKYMSEKEPTDDVSKKPSKEDVLTYQGYLARVLTAISFACILGILGFGFDRQTQNNLTLVLFCLSMPITLVIAMILQDPRRNYHRSLLMGVIYFLGLVLFAIAFVRLISSYSTAAGWSLGLMTLAMLAIASQAQDRFKKRAQKLK